jgi:hypothetical protein
MQREYKVQKGESFQDVVVKLYGSLEYQSKFMIDNNLLNVDIANKQFYNQTNKIVVTGLIENTNIEKQYILTENISLAKSSGAIKYFNFYDNQFGNISAKYFSSYLFQYEQWEFYTNIPGDDTYQIGQTKNPFPFYDFEDLGYVPPLTLINCEPYFEPFTVVYDDSIIKSVVPPITPAQIQSESNLKTYKTETKQSFFDISLITTGGLNNIAALAYQNNIDINTFDSIQNASINYYIEQIENRINYNFIQTLKVKPATAIQLETITPPTPGPHIAFNESFSNSFN